MRIYLEQFGSNYFNITIRYLVVATFFYLIFYVFFRKKLWHRKIQQKLPNTKTYRKEFGFSMLSMAFFACTTIPFFMGPLKPLCQVYMDFGDTSWTQLIWSVPLMMIIHDTYFYWMHKLFHHKAFVGFHHVHHTSNNPSPWAAFTFHPIEAFAQALITPIMLMLMPVHVAVFFAYFFFHVVYNVYGHLGFELYPSKFNKHWIGKWINTGVHHNLHHKYFNNSYGLYFTFWDRLMGTMSPKYDAYFEEVTSRTSLQG